MERIRAQVRQQQGDGRSATPTAKPQAPRRVDAPAAPAPSSISSQEELARLHSEVKVALEGHLQTGQLNPRHPGLHNDAVQFLKKAMRRSLTWYTRPLHLFQASVIRALQHVNTVLLRQGETLQSQGEALQRQGETLQRQGEALQNQSVALRQTSEQIENQSAALRQTTEQIQNQSAVMRQMSEQVRPLRTDVTALQTRYEELDLKLRSELDKSHAHQGARLDAVQAQLGVVQEQLRQLTAATRGKERDFRRLKQALESGNFTFQQPTAPTPPMFPSEIQHENEFDYFLFEDHYRGGEADIRERQNAYLELFRGRDHVVDIGCGRGEFLELLRDNDITARGIELGTDQYLLCREKGLDVVQQDLFTFLESQPDASLGGVFSAQVIEHMTASDQLRFVSLAYQKCSPNSPVLFETINPECVYALVHNFFLDPTHVRPVHPGTLKFAMESQGFRNVQLRFSSPVSDKTIPPLALNGDSESLQRFNAAMTQVNELLYGNQDYAAIGWK